MNLWGKIDSFSVVEIVQFLQSNQKSGKLEFSRQNEKIEMEFFQGSLVSGNMNGVDHKVEFLKKLSSTPTREQTCEAIAYEIQLCIQKLLAWRDGNFVLLPSPYQNMADLESKKQNILLPSEMRTEFLLMEAIRMFDETKENPSTVHTYAKLEKALKEYLFQAHVQKKTIKINVRSERRVRTLYFEQGELVLIMSNLPQESLGELLVKKAVITASKLQEIRALMEKTKKKQGELLVEQGILTAFEMFELLKEQMNEKIIHCFQENSVEIMEEPYDPTSLVIQKFPIDFFRCYVGSFPETSAENRKSLENYYLHLNDEGKKYLKTKTLMPHETKILRLLQKTVVYRELLTECKEHVGEATKFVDFLGSVRYLEFLTSPK